MDAFNIDGYIMKSSFFHLQNIDNDNTKETSPAVGDASANHRKSMCDTASTGVLLIADIIPSVLMNILCPFLPFVKK